MVALSDQGCAEPDLETSELAESPASSESLDPLSSSSAGGCGCGGHALNRQSVQPDLEQPQQRQQSEDDTIGGDTTSNTGNAKEEIGDGNNENDEIANLVHLQGGEFIMGANPKEKGVEEGPPRRVRVSPFSIGKYEVSNARFATFVLATGYVTEAEKFNWSFGVEALIPEEVKSTITQVLSCVFVCACVNLSKAKEMLV